MIHLGSLCPSCFHPAGRGVPQSRATPQGPRALSRVWGLDPSHPNESAGYESWPPPLPFNQVGILGWGSQGPSHVHSKLAAAPGLPVLPPGINSFRISVLEGSIPKMDTQHDCHALPGLDLTTQCGAGSWDGGAQHNHKGCLQAWPRHLSPLHPHCGALPREQPLYSPERSVTGCHVGDCT